MEMCVKCKRHYPVLRDGLCKNCRQKMRLIIEAYQTYMRPTRPNGKILDQTEWFSLKAKIDKFYYNHSQEQIDKLNEDFKLSKKGLNIGRRGAEDYGHIYLLSSSNGYYKIGKTKDMIKRMTTIKRQYPLEIKVVHSFRSTEISKVEAYLHRTCSDYKLQGEWFDLPESFVEWFKSLPVNRPYSLVDFLKKIT